MAAQAPSTNITSDDLDTAELHQAATEEGTPEPISALPNTPLADAIITHIQVEPPNTAITTKKLTTKRTNATITIEVKVNNPRNIRLPTTVKTRTTTSA
jgi:hypothetical protein